jgi:hypothetical protein
MTIEQTVDEMQIPRSAATSAHRELTGEMGLSTRCERRDFLVPDVHPFDLLLAPNGIGQTIQAVAHDAVDTLHTCDGKRRSELFRNGCHMKPL